MIIMSNLKSAHITILGDLVATDDCARKFIEVFTMLPFRVCI